MLIIKGLHLRIARDTAATGVLVLFYGDFLFGIILAYALQESFNGGKMVKEYSHGLRDD